MQFTEEEKQVAIALMLEGKTATQIGEALRRPGCKETAAADRSRGRRVLLKLEEEDKMQEVKMPLASFTDATQWPRLQGDYLVLSDLHIPGHDGPLLEGAIKTAHAHGVSRFLIVGDLMDANQFSKRGLQLGYQTRWQDDVTLAEAVLKEFLRCLPDGGTVLMGNHDAWYEKHYRGHIDPEFLFARVYGVADDPRIQFSRYEQCEVTSGDVTWRILHGANYSGANPLGVAQRLSAKFEQPVCMGHQHHACEGMSASGKHHCVCLGGCYNDKLLTYVHTSPRTNPAQTRSYGLLIGGTMRHFFVKAG